MIKRKLMGICMMAIIALGSPAFNEEPEQTNQLEVRQEMESLGTFEITAYSYYECGGESSKTASGTTPRPYVTVAVDPRIIPLGTKLYIEGVGEVIAEDTGGAVKNNVLDLHVGYDDPNNWGRQHRQVWIIR